MKKYTQSEVSQIFQDVPNKTLIYWARQELVEWVDEVEDGRGIHRKYSLFNLYQIAIVRELAGISLPAIQIRYTIEKHFKDFIRGGPLLPGAVDLGKTKPSEGDIMSNYLIIPKMFLLRRFGTKCNIDIKLCKPGNLTEELELMKDSTLITIIRLPLIAKNVQDRIAKLGFK
jgi:hypothetical protein